MPSLMTKTDPGLENALAIGQRLTGQPVHGALQITGGANNGIFRLEDAGKAYALKVYRRDDDDPRDRLATEMTAHAFFQRHGVGPVAKMIAADKEEGAALFGWIEGETIDNPREADIDTVMEFIATLSRLARQTDAMALPLASEACPSESELVSQIRGRFTRLSQIKDKDLSAFLADGFKPTLESLLPEPPDCWDLPPRYQTLSPSDFGFHNALKSAGGGITFLDFEYFGWDDPVKLAADTILHPGMNLDVNLGRYAARIFREIFSGDPDFSGRLRRSLPLYALRWCMILLNLYLRDCDIFDEIKWAQLQKAEAMLARAQKLNEEVIHGA